MTTTFKAKFDGKVLLPESPPDLVPGTTYTMHIDAETPAMAEGKKPDAWDVLESMIGTVEGPEDWSRNFDHYQYGAPRKEKKG